MQQSVKVKSSLLKNLSLPDAVRQGQLCKFGSLQQMLLAIFKVPEWLWRGL
jgi:hypothetical protein